MFASTFLKVLDKQGRMIRFRHNAAQRQYLASRTRRDIILKARQLGMSTCIQGEFFRLVTTRISVTATLLENQTLKIQVAQLESEVARLFKRVEELDAVLFQTRQEATNTNLQLHIQSKRTEEAEKRAAVAEAALKGTPDCPPVAQPPAPEKPDA